MSEDANTSVVGSDSDLQPIARRACLSCKKRRRKCTKQIPTCGECRVLQRECEYEDSRLKTSAGPRKLSTKEPKKGRNSKSLPFRASTKCLPPIKTNTGIPSSPSTLGIDVPIPHVVLKFLGGLDEILQFRADYERQIHGWMPVISSRLLRKALIDDTTEPRADLALLLLCMKLITTPPKSTDYNMRTRLWSTARSLYRSIDQTKRYSTSFLQSGLLITLYEVSHSLYPEAHYSLIKNARLGVELGIHELRSPKMIPAPASWAEEEERGRTWCGIVMLDRYVSLMIPGRELSTPPPDGECYLPADDEAWEKDNPVPRETLISSKASITPGLFPFARAAHASYLLGNVVSYRLEKSKSIWDDAQLQSTICALSAVISLDISAIRSTASCASFSAAIGLCNSAMIAINSSAFEQSTDVSIEDGESLTCERRFSSQTRIKEPADCIVEQSKLFYDGLSKCKFREMVSPLVLESGFQSAKILGSMWKKTREKGYWDAMECIKEALRIYSRRWGLAGGYSRQLDHLLENEEVYDAE